IAIAAASGARWAMVIEDDIDVCADFLESVETWLEEHARADRLMYALGANYAQIEFVAAQGGTEWAYPVPAFYGAQALAWAREDAAQLAEWLGPDPSYDGKRDHGHDLLLQRWGATRGLRFFAAAAPCFVD